jgi:anti-sigma factor RsiW
MISHLSPAELNSFEDGELSADQLASATEHLAGCPSCSAALLLFSVSIEVAECNVQRTKIILSESNSLRTDVCDKASLADASPGAVRTCGAPSS